MQKNNTFNPVKFNNDFNSKEAEEQNNNNINTMSYPTVLMSAWWGRYPAMRGKVLTYKNNTYPNNIKYIKKK